MLSVGDGIARVYGLDNVQAGETVEFEMEGQKKKIRFLNPEVGAINIVDPIPLHISAVGPKARRLTAELDADWMVPTGSVAGASAAIAVGNRAPTSFSPKIANAPPCNQ